MHFSLGAAVRQADVPRGMGVGYAVAVENRGLEAQGVRENGLRKAANAANNANAKGGSMSQMSSQSSMSG